MVTMSLERKKTLLERLAGKAGKAAAYASHYTPKIIKGAKEGTKKAYSKSISTYEKGLKLIEAAQKEQKRLKSIARKHRRATRKTKGKKRRKSKKCRKAMRR